MLTRLQTLFVFLPLLSGLASAGLVAQKRADICAKKGYDRGKGNYWYDDSGKYSTYAGCSGKCTADSKCKSFGFSSSGSECLLFNIALSGNFDSDSSSPDIYYDRGCVAASTTSTSTSTSTSSSLTTSTSTAKTTSSSTKTSTVSSTASSSSLSTSKTSTQSTSSSLSTSKAAVVTSSVSTTASSAASVTVPAGCSVPSTISMTTFRWFNSSHNLDCARPNYPSDAKVCWNSTSVCADNDPSCTCTAYCSTGIPAAAYQPLSYGPPDTISIAFDGAATGCSAANPQSIRRYEIGEGHFDCGSAADTIGFTGDSNLDSGNTGSVYYNAYGSTCNGKVARYTGSFPLSCSRDAGNNATCTAALPVALSLSSWL